MGGVGAHSVRLARPVGAAPIIAAGPLPSARERALAFGADFAPDPAAPDFADQVRAATDGRGLDFAFHCAGVPAVRDQAASVLGLGGSLILVGVTPRPDHQRGPGLQPHGQAGPRSLRRQPRGHGPDGSRHPPWTVDRQGRQLCSALAAAPIQ
ncbi:zinc-binding dehydrogenase [Streptomyces sp. AGS-58]|uniref:zinc-binding dehydrogenase n=1 Tax=unclassified Streptomyces TaxID=2593676 RepID=UPI0035A2741D